MTSAPVRQRVPVPSRCARARLTGLRGAANARPSFGAARSSRTEDVPPMTPIRTLVLLSGGLDSALAAKLLLEQGLEVIGLHLESPTACRSDVREVAREL